MIVLTGLLCRSHGFATKFPTLGRKKTLFLSSSSERSLVIQVLDMDGWVGVVNPSHFPSILLNPLPIAHLLFNCWACALPSFIWIENVG